MTTNKVSVLSKLKDEYEILLPCTPEENSQYENMQEDELPVDIYKSSDGSYKKSIPDEEIKLLLLSRQTEYIRTIKNCAIYFLVISIISVIIAIIFRL